MPAKVSLRDIVEAFDMQSDGFLSFVNIETGEVETVSREVMGVAEESEKGEDYEKGDDPQWDLAVKIASAPNYKGLPTQYDIHEWSIMEEFARSPASERMSGELLDALHGSGAFRHFKSTIRRLGNERDWYAFRDAALREIAKDWCRGHGLEWK